MSDYLDDSTPGNFIFTVTDELMKACEGTEFKPEDFLPKQAEPNATGWDCRIAENVQLKPGAYYKIPLGIRVICPQGWWLELRPRSSTFTKLNIHSHLGVIDQDFTEPMLWAFSYMPDSQKIFANHNYPKLDFGMRTVQLIPVKRKQMGYFHYSKDSFEKIVQERNAVRNGGFGSSGQK